MKVGEGKALNIYEIIFSLFSENGGIRRIDMTLGDFKPCKCINSQMMILINVINVSGKGEVGFVK